MVPVLSPSIVGRFSLLFVLFVALPTLGSTLLLSRLYSAALNDAVSRQSEETAHQILQTLNGEIDYLSFQTAALLYDRGLRSAMETWDTERIDTALFSFFNYTDRVGAVVLVKKGGGAYLYRNDPGIDFELPALEAAAAAAQATPGRVKILDTLEGIGPPVSHRLFTGVLAPLPDEGEDKLDCIVLIFREPFLDSLLTQKSGSPNTLLVYDRLGRPLLTTDPTRVFPETKTALVQSHSVVSTSRTVDATGWTLYLLQDLDALTSRIRIYDMVVVPALLVLVGLFLVYSRVFFARVAAPIRTVIDHMGRLEQGDFGIAIPRGELKELGLLIDSFNRMSTRIHQLQDERAEQERVKLGIELDALRYQINPHFLSNTLTIIRLMAQTARVPAIAQMTLDLITVLNDSYSHASVLAVLPDEFAHLQSYERIMKVRFGGLYESHYSVGPGCDTVLIQRMLLQPILENAILHGLAGKGGDGRIDIGAQIDAGTPAPPRPVAGFDDVAEWPGETLVLTIRDNGRGMASTPDLTEKTLESDDRRLARIGLANVQRRISLQFGPGYGLSFDSEPGRFTEVCFRLPVWRKTHG